MDKLCGMHRSALLKKGRSGFHVAFKKTEPATDWISLFTRILILMLHLVMFTLIKLKCSNFEAC